MSESARIKKRNHRRRRRGATIMAALLFLIACLVFPAFQPVLAADSYYYETDERHVLFMTKPYREYEKRLYTGRLDKTMFGVVVHGKNENPLLDPLFCLLPFINILKTSNPLEQKTSLPQLLEMDFTEAGMSRLAPRLQQIAFFGLLAYPPEQRNHDRYTATQIMIWETLGYTSVPFSDRLEPPTPSYPQDKALIEKRIEDWDKGPSFQGSELEILPGQSLMLKDEGYFIETFMPLAGFKAGEEKELKPGLFLSWDGGDALSLRADMSFSGTHSLNFSTPPATGAMGWYSEENQSLMEPSPFPEQRQMSLSVRKKEVFGSLEIRKTAPMITAWIPEKLDSGETLYSPRMSVLPQEGAVFALYNPSEPEAELRRLSTNAEGIARFDELPLGSYLLREIEVPEGFLPMEEKVLELKLSENGEGEKLKLEIENRREMFHVFFDKDFHCSRNYSDEELCSNTVFGLRSQVEIPAEGGNLPSGSLIALGRPQGERRSGLLPAEGAYSGNIREVASFRLAFSLPLALPCVLEEISVHPDFEKAEKVFLDPAKASRTEEGNLALKLEQALLNISRRGEIRLFKKGRNAEGDLITLTGARFSLWRAGELFAESSSGADGVCSFEVPDPGPWQLREEESPEGYLPFAGEKEIFLENYPEPLEMEIFNERIPETSPTLPREETESTVPPEPEAEPTPEATPPLSDPEPAPPPTTETVSFSPPVPSGAPSVSPHPLPATLLPGAFQPAISKAVSLPKTGMADGFFPGAFSLLLAALLQYLKQRG